MPESHVPATSTTPRMSSAVGALWREERAAGFHRLAGSRVSGIVPVREALIERVLAPSRLPSAVDALRVRLLADNLVSAVADVRVLGFRKRLEMTFRFAPAIDPAHPRRLHLFYADRSILTSALAFAGPFLPEWIARHETGLAVDLDRLAGIAGAGDLFRHVGRVAFEGHAGVLWINFEAEISDTGDSPGHSRPAPPPRSEPGGEGLRAAPRPEALVPLLEGASVSYRLRAEESLVNAALEAALEDARMRAPRAEETRADEASAGGGGGAVDWRTLVDLPAPRVSFESAALVMEGTLRLPGSRPQHA